MASAEIDVPGGCVRLGYVGDVAKPLHLMQDGFCVGRLGSLRRHWLGALAKCAVEFPMHFVLNLRMKYHEEHCPQQGRACRFSSRHEEVDESVGQVVLAILAHKGHLFLSPFLDVHHVQVVFNKIAQMFLLVILPNWRY